MVNKMDNLNNGSNFEKVSWSDKLGSIKNLVWAVAMSLLASQWVQAAGYKYTSLDWAKWTLATPTIVNFDENDELYASWLQKYPTDLETIWWKVFLLNGKKWLVDTVVDIEKLNKLDKIKKWWYNFVTTKVIKWRNKLVGLIPNSINAWIIDGNQSNQVIYLSWSLNNKNFVWNRLYSVNWNNVAWIKKVEVKEQFSINYPDNFTLKWAHYVGDSVYWLTEKEKVVSVWNEWNQWVVLRYMNDVEWEVPYFVDSLVLDENGANVMVWESFEKGWKIYVLWKWTWNIYMLNTEQLHNDGSVTAVLLSNVYDVLTEKWKISDVSIDQKTWKVSYLTKQLDSSWNFVWKWYINFVSDEVAKLLFPDNIVPPTISMTNQTIWDDWWYIPILVPSTPTVTWVKSWAVYEIVWDTTWGYLTINSSTWVMTWLWDQFGNQDYSITIKVTNPDWWNQSTTFNLHVIDQW